MFCDVSLPVPLDQPFTYSVPLSLQHRLKPGARVVVPFGSRKLTGVVLRTHGDFPEARTRAVEKLIDEEPIFDEPLLRLAAWVAAYYCAPLGEVLRGMAPTSAETTRSKVYALTDAGRDIVRQSLFGEEDSSPQAKLLRMLEVRPLSLGYLKTKVEDASRLLKNLEQKGLAAMEEDVSAKDPMRAPAEQLRVRFLKRGEGLKLPKVEREVLAYLELHPGEHALTALEGAVKDPSRGARALARRGLVQLRIAPLATLADTRPPHPLNQWQQAAFEKIRDQLDQGTFGAFLLQGVTGSGKTEVYLNAIEHALRGGRAALLLVPEIALTPAVAGQFLHRFGDRVAILHSAFSDSERAEQWRRIRSGEAGVVVGTRSGVFAPIRNLGLLIVDEEHDQSYKQQEAPRYNGRDVAVVRAKELGACVVVGSATPALETRYNVERGRYTLLELPERVQGRPMPEVELVDMREEFLQTRQAGTFSRRLLDALDDRLHAGEQTMLLLNRRGFSSFVSCRACGERVQCPNCAVTLTFHKRDKRLLCHYCNYAERVPDRCKKCDSEYLHFVGTGAEKVEDELHKSLPTARIARMDRDTVTTKRHFESILHGFREGNYDILVGTQMIAKGHDIPNVTLMGIVSADIGLGMPDFRAAERTFQLLTQASGRAGRGQIPGRVILQTSNPEHYAVRLASQQDYPQFYEKELMFRKSMRYPPFSALANILVRDEIQEEALRKSTEMERLLHPAPKELRVMGPAPAPVPRLKNEFRYQLLLKSSDRKLLNDTLHRLRRFAAGQKWGATALVIDVDPVSLL
ncbi:MAG TPA: primosomal protein N' [Bryobacteraceae bacterium]|nr:primosomal protein N' [Bryobacteraceae bacterium]